MDNAALLNTIRNLTQALGTRSSSLRLKRKLITYKNQVVILAFLNSTLLGTMHLTMLLGFISQLAVTVQKHQLSPVWARCNHKIE